MKIKHIFLFTVSGIFLAGCAGYQDSVTTNKPVKNFDVEFTVNRGLAKLKIVEKDRGCLNNNKGCMRVPKPNSGEIIFKFAGNQPRPCSAHPNSWVLSKVELANIEGGFGQEVNDWIVSDFGAEKSNGLVWQKGQSETPLSATVTDLNIHSGVVYYRITAETCDSSETANSDPRVINEGGSNIQ